MKYVSEYRDREKVTLLARDIVKAAGDKAMTIMEVCGTHTMALARFGIRKMMPPNIDLISGPGCPVCVTPNDYLDHAIALGRRSDMTICTFGDMMRVPGSSSSLEREHGLGSDIRVVYSTLDALEIARKNPKRRIVFLGVGFETTAPTIAASIKISSDENLQNYFVLCCNKTIPEALSALAAGPLKIDGFLLPGHVSTIIGMGSYRPLFDKNKNVGAIAGFEPLDILEAILDLANQISSGKAGVHNSYRRAVSENGNEKAKAVLAEVFEPCDAKWRGVGTIPNSGLKIRDRFKDHDAAVQFDVEIEPTVEPKGCRCGEILTGVIKPTECPLFGKGCTPEHPVGACMVSSEGTCAAYHRYGDA